jgi:hypothetical protein
VAWVSSDLVSKELARQSASGRVTRVHSRTVPSMLPVASVCPSGLNATEKTI